MDSNLRQLIERTGMADGSSNVFSHRTKPSRHVVPSPVVLTLMGPFLLLFFCLILFLNNFGVFFSEQDGRLFVTSG